MIKPISIFILSAVIFISFNSCSVPNGTKDCIDSSEGTIIQGKFYSNGELYTGCVERNDSTTPRAIFPLVNGILEGNYIEYYPDNRVLMSQEYSKGIKHGLYVIYWENNSISDSIHYVHGSPNGEVLGYHEDGSERSWDYYSNGKAVGASITFLDSTKQRYFWGERKNNLNVGDWYYKFENDSCLIRTFTENNNSFDTPCACEEVKYPPRDNW